MICDVSSPACVANVSAVATAAATIIAAIVTAWMAVETRRMARAAKRTIDLEYLPVLGIRDVRVVVSPSGAMQVDATRTVFTTMSAIQVGLELYNAGRVALTYRMKALSFTCAGRIGDSSVYLSKGGTALPGCSAFFWYAPLKLDPPIADFPVKGRIAGVIEYWHNDEAQRRELSVCVEVVVAAAEPGSPTNWFTIDGQPVA